jgi:hypothetical protein
MQNSGKRTTHIPRTAAPRFHCGKFLRGQAVNHLDGCFITTLYKRRAETFLPLLLLLLCDFESDIEFYRGPKGKAGNADYQPNRCFFNAKDI